MRIVLGDNQTQRREGLRRILLGEGLTCETHDAVNLDAMASRLAQVEADLVLVVCDEAVEPALCAIRVAHNASSAPIIAVGSLNNPEMIRQAMRAGAKEYLELGRLREELGQALIKIEADGGVPSERGKVVALFSPSGGVGVSTTAINLAARLGASMPNQVSLVDLKPAPSDLSVLLDLQPQYTLDQVCQQWQRLDRQMLASCMVQHSAGMHVLAQSGFHLGGVLAAAQLPREAVRQVVTLLRRMYAVTLLDLDHTLTEDQIEAMRLSNFVGLIARPDVPGLRRARWALDSLAPAGLPRERFRLVLNRFGQRGQIGVAKAEEILGIKVFQSIPEDHRVVNRAVNSGVPLADVSKLSRINRSFSSFAKSVRPNSRSAAV